jgi:hypothetical protein
VLSIQTALSSQCAAFRPAFGEGVLMFVADVLFFLVGAAAMYLLMGSLWKFFWS